MNRNLKRTFFVGLVASSLVVSVAPVMAWDWPWHRNEQSEYRSHQRSDDRDWDTRWGKGREYDEWQQARQQALYDASHHASRQKIAEDDARADEILNQMRHRH